MHEPSTAASDSANQPLPELIALGDQLGAARRARGISLEELAGRLCIGHDQLLAIETADSARLPEMVFVIAQARRVAASLGINAEDAIAALRGARPPRSGGHVSQTPSAPAKPITAARDFRPSGGTRRAAPPKQPVALPQILLPLLGLLLAMGAGSLVWQTWQRQRPISAESHLPPPTPTTHAKHPGTGTSTEPRPEPPAADQLVLRSEQESWLEVRDNAGVTVFQGTLNGVKSFPLGEGLKVMAGRPDLVKAELAGQPPRVLGSIDQVIWRSYGPARGSAGKAATPNASGGATAPSGPASPTAPAP